LIRYKDSDFAQIIIDDGPGNEIIDFILDRPDPDSFEKFNVIHVFEAIQLAVEKLRGELR
jgi:hypothetical protein